MSTIKDKISDLLTPYANEMEDERLGNFLVLSVGRILLRQAHRKQPVSFVHNNEMRHITDWLKASITNNDPWISNLDEKGNPRKLMKLNSIDEIYNVASTFIFSSAVEYRSSDKRIPEGLKVISLNVDNPETEEIPEGTKIRDILNIYGTKIKSLPESIAGFDSLYASDSALEEINEDIIKHLRYHLLLKNTDIKTFPSGLNVLSLNLNNSTIEKIPENTIVTHQLDIQNTDLKELPKSIKVIHNIRAKNSNLEKLNDNLDVHTLDLENAPISELPNGLKVYDLNIGGTNITKLPEDLKAQLITCDRDQIENIPDSLVKQGAFFEFAENDSISAKEYKKLLKAKNHTSILDKTISYITNKF